MGSGSGWVRSDQCVQLVPVHAALFSYILIRSFCGVTSVVGTEYPIHWAVWVSFLVWVEYGLGGQQWVGDAAGSGGRATPAAAMPMPMPMPMPTSSKPASHPYAHLLPSGPTYLPVASCHPSFS